jgi:hypothetical protein
MYTPDEIARILERKFGFVLTKSTHHIYYELNLGDDIPKIVTRFSHARTKDVGKKLEGAIARELHVKPKFFQGMLSCNHSREDYYNQVRNDPYPPFPNWQKGKN